MKMYHFQKIWPLVFLGVAHSVSVMAQDWNSSPYNWQNSPNNWENSSNNWRNSPNNWANSPDRWGNERTLRDSEGYPTGYAVPKGDGGVNFFDNEGNRRGYLPPSQ